MRHSTITNPSHPYAEALRLAAREATHSPDLSTQNGGLALDRDGNLILQTLSCNTPPPGVALTEERLTTRPLKYEITEHAERGIAYKASQLGISLVDSTFAVLWAACADCARAIILSGAERLVTSKQAAELGAGRDWDATISTAFILLDEAGVEVVWFDGDLGSGVTLRHSGKTWTP